MPVRSESQRRFMYATAAGKTDAPASVGRKYIAASHGMTHLPERVMHKVGKPKTMHKGLR